MLLRSASAPMFDRPLLRHRGFELSIRRASNGEAFSFAVTHHGLALHRSAPEFRTPMSADRAARRFVDDALTVFDTSSASLAA